MNPWLGVALTIGLLALNAVFVGSEFALISVRRTQLEPRAAAGSRPARLAMRAVKNINLVMAAAQLGITLCSLALGAIGEPAISELFHPAFNLINMPDDLIGPVSFVIALAIVAFAHVVMGEMVPKNLALVGPDRAALVFGPFMVGVIAVLKPFVVALNSIANQTVRLLRIEPRNEIHSAYTHDEVAGLVEESRREGLLDEDEYGLVTGALGFRAGTVEQVLMPLADLTTLPEGVTPAEIEEACAATGFSRFGVCDTAGDLVGYVHIKDVLEPTGVGRDEPIADKRVRPLATVPRTSGLDIALRTMQSRGAHMARVADDEGAVLGVVMLEDVLEELVGEVRDSGRGGR